MPNPASVVIEDLKTSCYFRIYAVFWVLLVIFGAIGVFTLMIDTSSESKEHWPVYVKRENQIPFPDFSISTLCEATNSTNEYGFKNISNPRCLYGPPGQELNVDISECSGRPQWSCFSVLGSQAIATPNQPGISIDDPNYGTMVCDFDVLAVNDYTVSVILPGNEVWIQPTVVFLSLTKEEFRNIKGMPSVEYSVSQSTHYVGNVTTGQTIRYRVFLSYKTFTVLNFVETNFFNGWKAVGEIGGVLFLFFIIHRILMVIVSFFVENNSKVLNGIKFDSNYAPL